MYATVKIDTVTISILANEPGQNKSGPQLLAGSRNSLPVGNWMPSHFRGIGPLLVSGGATPAFESKQGTQAQQAHCGRFGHLRQAQIVDIGGDSTAGVGSSGPPI